MKTTGDKILDRTLEEIGGKGLFVRELDAARFNPAAARTSPPYMPSSSLRSRVWMLPRTGAREGRVDLTVHSCKDLPTEIPTDLPIAAFTGREDPRDVLVLPLGVAEWV